jgi:hypothetical protein
MPERNKEDWDKFWEERRAAEQAALAEWLVWLFFISIPIVTVGLLLFFSHVARDKAVVALKVYVAVCVLIQSYRLIGKWREKSPAVPRQVQVFFGKVSQVTGYILLVALVLVVIGAFVTDWRNALITMLKYILS